MDKLMKSIQEITYFSNIDLKNWFNFICITKDNK